MKIDFLSLDQLKQIGNPFFMFNKERRRFPSSYFIFNSGEHIIKIIFCLRSRSDTQYSKLIKSKRPNSNFLKLSNILSSYSLIPFFLSNLLRLDIVLDDCDSILKNQIIKISTKCGDLG